MGKYRREGEKENSKCTVCEKPIWVRTGICTVYDGQGNYWNKLDKTEPCSYNTLKGSQCVDCYSKRAKYTVLE